MISYLKSLTLRQRANGILGLTALLYCFAFVGQFFFGSESWYQPLYWAVQSLSLIHILDAARTCVRLGCKSVTVAYRRSQEQMPALLSEYEEARAEGCLLYTSRCV